MARPSLFSNGNQHPPDVVDATDFHGFPVVKSIRKVLEKLGIEVQMRLWILLDGWLVEPPIKHTLVPKLVDGITIFEECPKSGRHGLCVTE